MQALGISLPPIPTDLQAENKQPWYERGLFLAAISTVVAIVLAVLAATFKDLRWLLFAAWPFSAFIAVVVIRAVLKSNTRRVVGYIFAVVVSGAVLLGVYRLLPAPLTQVQKPETKTPTSTQQQAHINADATAKVTHPAISANAEAQVKHSDKEAEKPTFLGVHPPTETLQLPPNSEAIVGKNIPPDVMADLKKAIADADVARQRLSHAPDKLTLRDLFLTDFNSENEATSTLYSGFTLKNDQTGTPTHIDYAVVKRLEIGSKFLLFYVPYAPDTAEICKSLAEKYTIALNAPLEKSDIAQKTPGDSEQTSSQDLVFSKRVFIYHDTYLSPEQIILVRDAFKRDGIAVTLRSTDYLENQKLQAKLKKLEKHP